MVPGIYYRDVREGRFQTRRKRAGCSSEYHISKKLQSASSDHQPTLFSIFSSVISLDLRQEYAGVNGAEGKFHQNYAAITTFAAASGV